MNGKAVPVAGLAAILVVAALLRLYDLDRLSFWLDESATVHFSAAAPWDILGRDTHPPLYYVLVHFWLQFGDSEWWLRFFSVLLSLGTVVAVFVAGRNLAGARAGLIAAALVAVSSFELRYAQEARMYALLSFGVALALAGLASLFARPEMAAARPRVSPWWLYIAGSSIALYAQTMGLLWPASATIAAVWIYWSRPERPRLAGNWLQANLIVLLIWALYWPWLYRQASEVLMDFHIQQPRSLDVVLDLAWIHFGQHVPQTAWQVVGAAFALLAVLLGVRALGARFGGALILLALLPFVLALAFGFGQPLYADRVLIWAGLPSALLAGAAIDWLWRRNTQILRVTAGAMLAVLLTLRAMDCMDSLREREKADWRAATAFLAETLVPGGVVVISPGYEVLSWDYYGARLAEEAHPLPPVEVVPVYKGWQEEAVARLIDLEPKEVTLVYSRWFKADRLDDPQAFLALTLGCAQLLEERRLNGISILHYATAAPTGDGCAQHR